MPELPSIDRLREQRWDIVRLLIGKHEQMVLENTKMRVVIDEEDCPCSCHDGWPSGQNPDTCERCNGTGKIPAVKPDHVVES